MNRNEPHILFGVGTPYVYEVYESLTRDGVDVRAFVDNQNLGAGPFELGHVIDAEQIPQDWTTFPLLFPLLTPGHRVTLLAQAQALGFTRFPSHCDPTSVVAGTATLDDGVLINALVTVGAMTKVGRFSIINRSASVGHHVVLEPFTTLGPSATLCGSSTIGRGTFIGAGAVVNPKVNIGANSIIGSGAVVLRDVGDRCVAVGNPAKVIKTGIAGYNDVSV